MFYRGHQERLTLDGDRNRGGGAYQVSTTSYSTLNTLLAFVMARFKITKETYFWMYL